MEVALNNENAPGRALQESLRNLGLPAFCHYVLRRLANRLFPARRPYRLYSRYAREALWVRPETSDIDVFAQIFRLREYRCLDSITQARLIVDCGANVGFASAYFLSRFPDAKLIAVEPDEANFSALLDNLAPYCGRATAHCTGVWSHSCGLVLESEGFGDGREWARTVRESRRGETPMMMATDIGALLQESGETRISILKIDIEGAEAAVFSGPDLGWLDKVDVLVIELHGRHCEEIFFKAIQSQSFAVSTCDELTVCMRRG